MDEQQTQQPQPPTPSTGEDKDIQENKLMAALSYIGILVLIPLLAKKESKFCQFHAKQGLVFLIFWVIGWIVFWIPVVGWLLWLVVAVLDLIAFIQALTGKYWEVPILGQLAKKINI